MRMRLRLLTTFVIWAVGAGIVAAQAPVLLSSPTAEGSAGPLALPWSVDLLLGLPTGVRVQRDLLGDDQVALLAEGFLGFDLLDPTLGAGARARFVVTHAAGDALFLNPGVDFYGLLGLQSGGFFSGHSDSFGLITGDVDLSWQHCWGDWDGELGVKLGAGAVLGNGNGWVPVIALFGGLRF
jgi:hypothetical protein